MNEMKRLLTLASATALICVLPSFAPAAEGTQSVTSPKMSPKNPVGWKDFNPAQFGCFLEKQFGYRDKKFNCSLKAYKPTNAQPCTPGHYEHPEFPISAAQKINPLIKTVGMEWAAGKFLAVSFGFPQKTLTDWEILEAFDLPRNYSEKKAEADGIYFSISYDAHAGTRDIYIRYNRGYLPECGED